MMLRKTTVLALVSFCFTTSIAYANVVTAKLGTSAILSKSPLHAKHHLGATEGTFNLNRGSQFSDPGGGFGDQLWVKVNSITFYQSDDCSNNNNKARTLGLQNNEYLDLGYQIIGPAGPFGTINLHYSAIKAAADALGITTLGQTNGYKCVRLDLRYDSGVNQSDEALKPSSESEPQLSDITVDGSGNINGGTLGNSISASKADLAIDPTPHIVFGSQIASSDDISHDTFPSDVPEVITIKNLGYGTASSTSFTALGVLSGKINNSSSTCDETSSLAPDASCTITYTHNTSNNTDAVGQGAIRYDYSDGITSHSQYLATTVLPNAAVNHKGGYGVCWGDNEFKQAGVDSTGNIDTPTNLTFTGGDDNAGKILQISTSSTHTCAIVNDDQGGNILNASARCWGDNDSGQLGIGSTGSNLQYQPQTVYASGTSTGGTKLTGVFQISTSPERTCALLTTGDGEDTGVIKCWGSDTDGALGNGSTSGVQPNPVPVLNRFNSTLTGMVQIASGTDFSCALGGNGAVFCWGKNNAGQLGNGTITNSDVAVQVANLGRAIAISAGDESACAVLDDGTMQCWGDNAFEQIGNNTSGGQYSNPQTVQDNSGTLQQAFASTSLNNGNCALVNGTSSSEERCWGNNDSGQTGTGTASNHALPVKESDGGSNLADILQISAVSSHHNCTKLAGGTAACWGVNDHEQIANSTADVTNLYPLTMQINLDTDPQPLSNVLSINAGGSSSCALLTAPLS